MTPKAYLNVGAIRKLPMPKLTPTPTPWHTAAGDEYFRILDKGGWAIAGMRDNSDRSKADAAFIVKAVNAYERDQKIIGELVKVCKAGARMLLRNTLQDVDDTDTYNQMKQAISKAEGK